MDAVGNEGGGALTPGTPIAQEEEGEPPSGNDGDVIAADGGDSIIHSPSPHPYTPPFSPPPSSGEGSPYYRDSEEEETRVSTGRGRATTPPPKRRKKGKSKENAQVEEFRHKVIWVGEKY